MKIYVDLSCDKVSGQQNMQRALLNEVKKRGLFAEKCDADVLVYVQIPFDESLVDDWTQLKKDGKKIIFIHHYMSKSFYERCAIFKIAGLFELIDYHVCISKECELYDYLCSRVSSDRIFVQELAAAEYKDLLSKYYQIPFYKDQQSICFVGKVIKGLDKFVNFCSKHKFKRKVVLCPDVQKFDGDLTDFEVYTNKKFDEVYQIMHECQFIYCPSVYNTPPMHLETVLQEAIPCGCVPVVDSAYRKIMKTNDLASVGFMEEDKFTYDLLTEYQSKAICMQQMNYKTLSETLDILIKLVQKVCTFE